MKTNRISREQRKVEKLLVNLATIRSNAAKRGVYERTVHACPRKKLQCWFSCTFHLVGAVARRRAAHRGRHFRIAGIIGPFNVNI